MKTVWRGLCCAGLLVAFASLAPAASMTLTGSISDSMCGASHAAMKDSHAGLTDKACTQTCVKAGAKYVFVSNNKVYNIENQNFAALMKNAGDTVSLTGNFDGDNVTVSKISAAKK